MARRYAAKVQLGEAATFSNMVDLFLSFCGQVDCDNGSCEYYDPVDENQCNWMMFVRPASVYSEQNLVAYQFRHDIYFSTITNIQPGQELKVSSFLNIFYL